MKGEGEKQITDVRASSNKEKESIGDSLLEDERVISIF